MAKGKKKVTYEDFLENESSVPPILDIAYSDPLFSAASHPSKPIFIAGLATGHVFCHSYDADKLEEQMNVKRDAYLKNEKKKKDPVSKLKSKWWATESDHANLTGEHVGTNWKTKRHKGSCRSVIFDVQENSVGENIYTAGTDHIIKKAATETGKVTSKVDISTHFEEGSKDAATTLVLSSTHPFLLCGTENGHILVFDSNNLNSKSLKFEVDNAHGDAVNKIIPMPAVSAYHFLSLGSTTLAHIDIRKGVITQSDDQEDELLSMCYPASFVNDNKNDTVVVSHGEGIVTLWKNSKNGFQDQLQRVKVNKNASIDAIISTMNCGDEEQIDSVWCGDSEGLVHRVDYKKGKVVETRVHSSATGKHGAVDEVGGLDIDYDYRLISSGMEGLKIWSGQGSGRNAEDSSDEDLDSDDDSGESDSDSSIAFSSDDQSDIEGQDSEAHDSDKNDSSDNNEFSGSGSGSDSESEAEVPASIGIVRKKRGDVSQVLKKPKKAKIDINKMTVGSIKDDEPEKKKQVKAKKAAVDRGISRFDDL